MTGKPRLLSGGNPQIAKGYGEAPVKAWLDAVPGWKQAVCRRIDKLVSETVTGVNKAVKWNSPLYGMAEGEYFLSFHCFDRYVKIAFHNGGSLDPPPPERSKYPNIRYLHVHEGDELGAQFTDWVKQASKLPGEKM